MSVFTDHGKTHQRYILCGSTIRGGVREAEMWTDYAHLELRANSVTSVNLRVVLYCGEMMNKDDWERFKTFSKLQSAE